MAETIFRGYSIRFYNPIIPTHRAIPWSRGLYLASHFPRILSIPKLVLIFLLNPESRASNTGNHVSRKTYWDPLFSCFFHATVDWRSIPYPNPDDHVVWKTNCRRSCCVYKLRSGVFFFGEGRQATKKNTGSKDHLIAVNCVYFVFPFFSCQASVPILCYLNCFYLKSELFPVNNTLF